MTPQWAVGMERLTPGVYADKAGDLHLCAREMCEAIGWPYTKENAAWIYEQALKVIAKVYGRPITLRVVEDPPDA